MSNALRSEPVQSTVERICHPVSIEELERRWMLTRAHMRSEKIDVLVAQGANSFSGGGYYRWLTGQSAGNYNPNTLIFPVQGLLTLIGQGPMGGEATLGTTDPTAPGVGRRVFTPSYPAVHYTKTYDADLAAREIRVAGASSVGLVGSASWYHGFGARLKEQLAGMRVVDATDTIDEIKAEKSAEEISLLRKTAAMQDEVMLKVAAHVRDGMTDFEVMAYAQYVAQLLGSEQGAYLGSSAATGRPAELRPRVEQARRMGRGDVFLLLLENSGPGGFYTHLARIFVLGKASQELQDTFDEVRQAQDFTLGQLDIGRPCREVFEEYNGYMRSRALPEERRLHCHGQGYDLVERPLIRADETMTIAANMNIGIHPTVANERIFVTFCDNFLLRPGGGAERLHRTPQKILEL